MKKKVLFMLDWMNVGGTEKAFLNLVDTMSPEEYEVTLLLLRRQGGFLNAVPEWVKVETIEDATIIDREIKQPPLPIVREHLKNGKIYRGLGVALFHLWFKLTGDRLPYYRFLFQSTNKRKYDVAVAYAGPLDAITTYIVYCVEAPVKVQWIHFDVGQFWMNLRLSRRLYPKFQRIYVVSNEARESLIKALPEVADFTVTKHNVIPVRRCKELAELGESFDDNFNGKKIVTVGRLSITKGQDIIPEVAADLVSKGIDFRWYLVGDGKLRSVIEEKAAVLGVSDRVVLLGTKTNPYPYLKDADLYVQTSVHEGFCITLGEAKAFDLPIVSTNCAGAHEQLDGLSNSRIVERKKEEILQAVMDLLGK